MPTKPNKIRVGILGASGYTGAELVRLLVRHPQAGIALMTADRHAGESMAAVFPHLAGHGLPDLIQIDQARWDAVDMVFCCLPHGATQEIIAGLPERLRVVDLSADFRLADVDVYAEWYGQEHLAPELQGQAVYGLTEFARDDIKGTRLVASPGCYPTSALLPLLPLLEFLRNHGVVAR